MCDLDGAMDEFEKVKAERDRLRDAAKKAIVALEILHPVMNPDEPCIVCEAWTDLKQALAGKEGGMKYEIGDLVADEDGNHGTVIIRWNDGDLCFLENDAAHPNPVIVGHTDWPKGKP